MQPPPPLYSSSPAAMSSSGVTSSDSTRSSGTSDWICGMALATQVNTPRQPITTAMMLRFVFSICLPYPSLGAG